MVEFPQIPRLGIQPIAPRAAEGKRGERPGVDSPIGMFDSGVGGLTVLRQLMRALPNEDVIYLADSARVPFGSRSAREILRINLEIIRHLIDQGVKMVIMACGTSSSIAYPLLKDKYNIPIVGLVEPGAKEAVEKSRNGKIGLIATEGTVESGLFERTIKELRRDAEVVAVGCPLFVPLVEGGFLDTPETEKIAREYLTEPKSKGVDTLIYGCTHYPHLEKVIRKIMGGDVQLVDPGQATVAEAAHILSKEGLLRKQNPGANYEFRVTGPELSFQERGSRLLGRTIPNVKRVSLKRIPV